MSVTLMSLVYAAHFRDIEYIHQGTKKTGESYSKTIRVLAPNVKSVCLALADHANDEGEGAYPSITKIESKTELSRVTVIACIKAMREEKHNILTYVGISKRGTCNYTINKEKIIEMASWERQKREKSSSKAALLGKATLPEVVKPLDHDSKAAIPESSVNHPQTTHLGAAAPAQPVKPKKRGDMMDGILFYQRLAEDKQTQLADRVNAYPPDVQDVLLWFVDVYGLLPSAIPAKPTRGSKGGDYALWINELREINNVLEGFGHKGIEATRHPCANLSVSHPGAIMWCLPAEIGKLAQRTLEDAERENSISADDWRKQINLYAE